MGKNKFIKVTHFKKQTVTVFGVASNHARLIGREYEEKIFEGNELWE